MERKAVSGIMAALLLVGMLTLLSFNEVEAPSWWNFDWKYRAPVRVEERSGNTLTDFQVSVNVDTASLVAVRKMQANGSDIRFTDSANNEIPYWIESGINSENTTIWVKVPQIPASGTETIYMYYGNSAANSVSKGEAVFDFFDDFKGTTINSSKWTTVGTYFAQDAVLKTTGGPGAGGIDGIYSVNNYSRPFVLEWKERVVGYGALWLYTDCMFGTRLAADVIWANSRDCWCMGNILAYPIPYPPYRAPLPTPYPNHLDCCENGVTRWDESYYWTLGTWYDFKLVIKSAGIIAFVDGVQKWNGTGGTISPLYIGAVYHDGQFEWDNVKVRKYAFPEPASLLGSEVPEFPSFLILSIFMIATLLAVIVCIHMRKKTNKP